ncbi:MAG: FlgD immunoglobulin-like domain containing protein [bacterium]
MRTLASTVLLVFLSALPFSAQAQEWTHNGPWGSGRSSLHIDPVDTSIMYRFTEARGIWKSTNSGVSWTEINNGLPVIPDTAYRNSTWGGDFPYPRTFKIHPTRPNELWVLFRDQPIYRSDDAGASWYSTADGFPSGFVPHFVFFYRTDPDTVFIGGEGGLYRSDDGGQNWTLVESAPNGEDSSIGMMYADPLDNLHLFMGVDQTPDFSFTGSLMESRDGGRTWEDLYPWLTFLSLEFDPSDTNRFWAMAFDGYQYLDLWESDDRGASWTRSTLPQEGNPGGVVAVNSAIWIVVSDSFYRTHDGGETWEPFAESHPPGMFGFKVNPLNPLSWYMFTVYGLYHTSDDGATWEALPDIGMDATSFSCIVPHPVNPNRIYAGGVTGLFRSDDGGENWQRVEGASAEAVALDPSHPDTLYFGGTYHHMEIDPLILKRSFDGGNSWEQLVEEDYGSMSSMVVDPRNSAAIYYGDATGGLYRSSNFGISWSNVDYGSFLSGSIYSIQFHPFEDGHIYFGQHGIFRSEDDGQTWSNVVLDNDPKTNVLALCVDKNTGDVYAATTAYDTGDFKLFVSKDNCNSFTDLRVPLIADSLLLLFNPHRILNVILNPFNSANIVIVTSLGLMESADGGDTWSWVEESPPEAKTVVSSLDGTILYVGTLNHGIWSSSQVLGVGEPSAGSALPETFQIVSIYPNPFNSNTTVAFDLPESADVHLLIYNIQGQLVRSLHTGFLTIGQHRFVWDGRTDSGPVANGVYIISVQTSMHTINRRITLVR